MPASSEISQEIQHACSGATNRCSLSAALIPSKHHGSGREYSLRLASSQEEKVEAFRLRFHVFNLELNEGLEGAYATGCDMDEFDAVCDHLIVQHKPSGKIVATYRMHTGVKAAANLGYYSEREFDFSPFEAFRSSLVEVGRAAIVKEHRTFEVLNLLWKGIGKYAVERGGRYLVGCSSLTSQNPAEGLELYRQLKPFLAAPELQTKPQLAFSLNVESTRPVANTVAAPRLLRAYLNLGARICSEPALDYEFKTIDFLTFLDLESMPPVARSRFLDTG